MFGGEGGGAERESWGEEERRDGLGIKLPKKREGGQMDGVGFSVWEEGQNKLRAEEAGWRLGDGMEERFLKVNFLNFRVVLIFNTFSVFLVF